MKISESARARSGEASDGVKYTTLLVSGDGELGQQVRIPMQEPAQWLKSAPKPERATVEGLGRSVLCFSKHRIGLGYQRPSTRQWL